MKDSKETAKWVLTIFVMMTITIVVFIISIKGYQSEIDSLKQQLVKAQQHVPLDKDTVYMPGDTVEVATSPVIMAKMKELKKQHLIDEQLIKELKLQLKQLDGIQSTSIETKDTARAAYDHNFKVFSYSDRWSDLKFWLHDSTFYYNIRDSLEIVVFHEYKHRFLWWKWGVKGYKVKVANFNPHSTTRYNTYIKPEK